MPAARRFDRWTPVLAILAAGSLANGIWMLVHAAGWYRGVTGVPDFGPLNEHFVRDVGAVFVTFGAGLAYASLRGPARAPIVVLAAIFYALHAGGHVYDTLRGAVGADHWWIDFPGVYLPALLLVWASLAFLRAPPARA